MSNSPHLIPDTESATLSSIFSERVQRTPGAIAYIQFHKPTKTWQEFSWRQMADDIARLQRDLLREGLKSGDKIAIMSGNSREWVMFDQAAHGLGLVVVPIYTNDRPDNVAYILENAEVKLLVVENAVQLRGLDEVAKQLNYLKKIISIKALDADKVMLSNAVSLGDWISPEPASLISKAIDKDALATIVYTSGTTGKPKGVMLSHRNILNNVYSALQLVDIYEEDRFLSFLPLSHMLERMAGYYLPIVSGSSVAFSRSIPQLASDLVEIKPTVMVSVPRIFERVYGKIQDKLAKEKPIKKQLFMKAVDIGWKKFQYQQGKGGWSPALLFHPVLDKLVGAKIREKMGGSMRLTVCGGAALSDSIARFFIGLGIPILQGYGLTETSPVISVNTLQSNDPSSIGVVLPGIEVRIGESDEIQTKSDCVMLGYWKNDQASSEIFDEDGWLHTGDKGKIENGHLYITGRIKEIIVLANGEKIPPSDMELAVSLDKMIEQAMIIGEGHSFLSALVVLNEDALDQYREQHNQQPDWDFTQDKRLKKVLLDNIKTALHDFPGYAKIRRITICHEPWTVENGLLTPTLKTKRAKIESAYTEQINAMYEGQN